MIGSIYVLLEFSIIWLLLLSKNNFPRKLVWKICSIINNSDEFAAVW